MRTPEPGLALICDLLAARAGADDRLRRLPAGDVAALVAIARAHGVEAWLAGRAPSDAGPWRELAEQRRRFVAARARAQADVRDFGAVVASVGSPWVAVKGLAVAEDLYPAPSLRYGVDIDTLVPPEALEPVIAALQDAGWRLLDRNWPLVAARELGELRLVSAQGTLFDVHWSLLNTPQLRRAFHLPTSQLLARRRQLPSGTPVLHADDQLVHLAVHGALAGGNRLLWLADLALALRRVEDWDALAERVRQARAGTALTLLAGRAARYLDAPLPPTRGAGAWWRALCAAVDAGSPLAADPGRPALARSFGRSVHPTTAGSLTEFVQHVGAFGLAGLVGRRDRPLPADDDPASPLLPVDDRAARDRYFASLAVG